MKLKSLWPVVQPRLVRLFDSSDVVMALLIASSGKSLLLGRVELSGNGEKLCRDPYRSNPKDC
jgi:hypothetical protein